jgi:hypothetical protein
MIDASLPSYGGIQGRNIPHDIDLEGLKASLALANTWRLPFFDPAVVEAFVGRVEYSLAHGETMRLSTGRFGGRQENTTRVPGLISDHVYSVLGIERSDSAITLVLDSHTDTPQTARGVDTGRPGPRHRARWRHCQGRCQPSL